MLCPAMLGPLGGASSRRKRGAKFTKGSRWIQWVRSWSFEVSKCVRDRFPDHGAPWTYGMSSKQRRKHVSSFSKISPGTGGLESLLREAPWSFDHWSSWGEKVGGCWGLDTSPTTKATPSLNFPNHNVNTPQTLGVSSLDLLIWGSLFLWHWTGNRITLFKCSNRGWKLWMIGVVWTLRQPTGHLGDHLHLHGRSGAI